MMPSEHRPLQGIEAYLFDVFGTVVDWYGSISGALKDAAPFAFADEGELP